MMLSVRNARLKWFYLSLYCLVAILYLFPITSGFQRYFPVPMPQWTEEGEFLRRSTETTDLVVSPTTGISLFPPQRISLAERVVHFTPGALDVMNLVERTGRPDLKISAYGPETALAMISPAEISLTRDGQGRGLARFDRQQFEAFAQQLNVSRFLRQEEKLLTGHLQPWSENLERLSRPLPLLRPPIGLHARFRAGNREGRRTVHWQNDGSCHFQSEDAEIMILDGQVFEKTMGWRKARKPPQYRCDWSGVLTPLLAEPLAKPVTGALWNGIHILELPVVEVPSLVHSWAPEVERWQGWVFASETQPLGLVLTPLESHQIGHDGPVVTVALDNTVRALGLPSYVSSHWTVIKARPVSPIKLWFPWTLMRPPDAKSDPAG
jgi:hypothetical protein